MFEKFKRQQQDRKTSNWQAKHVARTMQLCVVGLYQTASTERGSDARNVEPPYASDGAKVSTSDAALHRRYSPLHHDSSGERRSVPRYVASTTGGNRAEIEAFNAMGAAISSGATSDSTQERVMASFSMFIDCNLEIFFFGIPFSLFNEVVKVISADEVNRHRLLTGARKPCLRFGW